MKKNLAVVVVFSLCLLMCTLFSGCSNNDDNLSSADFSAIANTIPPEETPAPAMAKIVVVGSVDGGLNIRASASTDGEVLGQVNSGEKFRLLVDEQQNGWYQIQYQSKSAFVYAEYVTVQEVTVAEANSLSDNSSSSAPSSTATPNPEDGAAANSSSSGQESSNSTPSQFDNLDEDGQA